MERDTRDLVAAAQRGDRNAFGELVERHLGMVCAVAMGTAREWHAAQDIAQDAFISAWHHLDQLRQPEAFPMWIRRIARNLAANWVRSERYRERLAERHADTHGDEAFAADPIAALARREELAHVMESLSNPIAEVMVLHYLQERSVLEIGVALGISESAVKKRLQRGREALRDRLEATWKKDVTRGEDDSIRAAAKKIVMGLGAGPAMPALSQKAAAYGPMVLAHHVAHGGAFSGVRPALAAGMMGGGKTVVAVGVVVALAALVALWMREPDRWEEREAEGNAVVMGALNLVPAMDGEEEARDAPITSKVAPEHVEGETTAKESSADVRTAVALNEEQLSNEPSQETWTAHVEGCVVTPWDDPVPDVRVVALAVPVERLTGYASTLKTAAESVVYAEAISDIEGHFSMALENANQGYSFSLVDSEYQGATYTTGISPAGESEEITIVAERGVTLNGRLVDPYGHGIPAAYVEGVGIASKNGTRTGALVQTIGDEEGYFTLIFDREGNAIVRAVSEGFGEQLFSNVPVGRADVITLTFRQPASIAGWVRFRGDEPAKNVTITLESEMSMPYETHLIAAHGAKLITQSGEDGQFAFEAVLPDVRVTASVNSEQGVTLLEPETIGPFAPGEAGEWNPVLEGTTTLRGTLLGSPSGAPIPDGRVVIFTENGPFAEAAVAQDGTYEIVLPLSLAEVWVLPVYMRVDPRALKTMAPELVAHYALSRRSENALALELPDPYCVNIRIETADSESPRLAFCDIEWTLGNTSYSYPAQWPVNEAVHWCGVAPFGTTSVGAEAPGYCFDRGREYAGASGDEFEEEVLVLYRQGGVSGTAVDGTSGDPLANTELVITLSYDDGDVVRTRLATSPSGHFRSEGVIRVGRSTIRIRVSSAPNDDASWTSSEIVISPDHVVDLGLVTLEPIDFPHP